MRRPSAPAVLASTAALVLLAACHTAPRTGVEPVDAPASDAPPVPRGFVARTTVVDGATYHYQVYVPDARRRRLPVVLFLHGSGERGSDGVLQTFVGLGPHVRGSDGRFPAIVVLPQAPADSAWVGAPARAAMQALDAAIAEFSGDPRRVYLTGVSMGGYGTWQLALDNPGRFAALAPVCGGVHRLRALPVIRVDAVPDGAPDTVAYVAGRLAAVPTWIFHGGEDHTVPVANSREMAAALRKLGAPVRYTEYPGVGHNSWEAAYGEPSLWRWMFAQRLPATRSR